MNKNPVSSFSSLQQILTLDLNGSNTSLPGEGARTADGSERGNNNNNNGSIKKKKETRFGEAERSSQESDEEEGEKSWWTKWKVAIFIFFCIILVGVSLAIGLSSQDKAAYFPDCEEEDFHCPSNGLCLKLSQLCDGIYDCNFKHRPKTWQFESWDSTGNFPEFADEMGCFPPFCSRHDYQCSDGACVSNWTECTNEEEVQHRKNSCGERGLDFSCGNGNHEGCIPRHYLCNGLKDCRNGRDEEHCGPPVIIKPPEDNVKIMMNQSFTLTCHAAGTPTPFIRWRHNLSTIIPPHCHSKTFDGRGKLTCNVTSWDDYGHYFCQAVNSFGSTFSTTYCDLHT